MDLSFHYLLMANHAMIQKKLLLSLKETGLTIGQPKVLDYLKDHNGASQKEIALGCHIEAPSLTSILNRMEENNFIERKMLNGNRRSYYIFLTENGRKYQQITDRSFDELEETAFDGITDNDREQFMNTMLHIYNNLKQN